MILPVILAGGSGDRLWPWSREAYPKQFLPLMGKYSPFQETLLRLPQHTSVLPPLIVCHEDHRFLVAEQLRVLGQKPSAILLEPCARNTAPAIALAACWANNHRLPSSGEIPNQNAVNLLVLPSDHSIQDLDAFHEAIEKANLLANNHHLVCFGIPPSRPETGYGYIRAGKALSPHAYQIKEFIEKPSEAHAKALLQARTYHWNSGIFLFSAADYLKELKQFEPLISKHVTKAFEQATCDQDFTRPATEPYESCPKKSIDYAVMEKTKQAAVILLHSYWHDLGTWTALWETREKDAQGNVNVGRVQQLSSHNTLVHAEHRLVTTLGVEDLIVVETADAVLVCDRDHSQEVKQLVQLLHEHHCPEVTQHRKVLRPWGHYEQIAWGDRFQVKHIVVQPHKRLSLQLHHRRSEHWVVVKGQAKVTRGEETFQLTENQATYIPMGTKHRLENTGSIPLEIIEIQSGSYLGEDDIIRFADDHGRVVQHEVEYNTASD